MIEKLGNLLTGFGVPTMTELKRDILSETHESRYSIHPGIKHQDILGFKEELLVA